MNANPPPTGLVVLFDMKGVKVSGKLHRVELPICFQGGTDAPDAGQDGEREELLAVRAGSAADTAERDTCLECGVFHR